LATKLTHKIKEDYGTLRRFCKIHGINARTFNVVVGGFGTSAPIVSLLMEKGYIKDPSELKRKSA